MWDTDPNMSGEEWARESCEASSLDDELICYQCGEPLDEDGWCTDCD